jgi:hypothetical protein
MKSNEIFNCFYFGETEKIKEFVLFDIYKKIYQIVLDYFQAESEKFLNEIDDQLKEYYSDSFMFLNLGIDIIEIFRKLNSEFVLYLSEKINEFKLDEIYNLIFIENENSISKEQKAILKQIKSIYKKTKFGFFYFDAKNPKIILENNGAKIQIDLIDICKKIKFGFSWLGSFNYNIKVKINLGDMFTKKHGKIDRQEDEKRKKICFNIYYKLEERIILNEPIISLRETCRNEFNNDREVRAVYKNPEALIKQMQRLLNALGEKDLTYKVKK